jgi:hypothetical protein
LYMRGLYTAQHVQVRMLHLVKHYNIQLYGHFMFFGDIFVTCGQYFYSGMEFFQCSFLCFCVYLVVCCEVFVASSLFWCTFGHYFCFGLQFCP